MIWGSFKRTQTKRRKEKRMDEVTEAGYVEVDFTILSSLVHV